MPCSLHIETARFPQDEIFQDGLLFARGKLPIADLACDFQIDGLRARWNVGNLLKRKAARLNRNCAEHNASAMRVREASSDLNGQPKGVDPKTP